MEIVEQLSKVRKQIPENATLVAVSKTQPDEAILSAHGAGQRHFGENRVQDLKGKAERLPSDILWHMIGHIQTNKIKDFIGFVHMVHGLDRLKVLHALQKEAAKAGRKVHALLQVHIAKEDSKFGFYAEEIRALCQEDLAQAYPNLHICGLMGMATFTQDTQQIRDEFTFLAQIYQELQPIQPAFNTLSMGMSGDFPIALECGSNLVRVGTAIFGTRTT